MLKNIFISLMAHIVVIIGLWLTVVILYKIIWVFIIFILPFIAILPYVFVRRVLVDQKSRIKNLFSVSSTFFVLVIIWFASYFFEPTNNPVTGYMDGNMIVSYISNPLGKGLLLIADEFLNIKSKVVADILMVVFAAIPTLLMWAGLELNSKKNKKMLI